MWLHSPTTPFILHNISNNAPGKSPYTLSKEFLKFIKAARQTLNVLRYRFWG